MPLRPPSSRPLAAGLAGLLSLAVASAAAAQPAADAAARTWSFGLLAGVNMASFGGDDAEELDDGRTGLVVGGFAVRRLSPVLAFQPEVLYAQKGAGGSFVDETGAGSADFKLSYLEVPLLLRVDVPGGTGVRPFLLAGPSLALNLGCEVDATFEGLSATFDCEDADTEAQSFDVGGLVGGGLEFPLGARALSVGVRYTFGFGDVFDGANVRNRALGLVAGLRF